MTVVTRKPLAILVAVGVVALVANFVYPFVWYSPAIDGRVIDATTGRPVPGAVVLMTWEKTGIQGTTLGVVAIEEVAASESGEFHIPAWGPRISFHGTVKDGQPTTRVLHRDYAPLAFFNTSPIASGHDPRFIRIPYHHDDKPIALSAPATAVDEEVAALAAFVSTMWFAYAGKQCEWTHAQRSLAIIDDMRTSLQGTTDSGRLDEVMPLDLVRKQGNCESQR
ncbi:hypothetical protein ACFPN2_26355 [Steroidobacter flavus]|uniref:Carboxypeptidase regulatory-like domain-containing protein n=1 Tax=Steroidobacter flavus TaxID=1842136 RepID=A0ABV8SYG4_9GAMM